MTKFRITRTSADFFAPEQPCAGAIREEEIWTIEIEDVFEFAKKLGEPIILSAKEDGDLPFIEIYDDYRE